MLGAARESDEERSAKLEPVVMGVLGRTKRQAGVDAPGLFGLLAGERQKAEQQAPDAMKVFNQLLDRDGDGSTIDDVAKIGSSLLGGFFK